MSNTIFTVSTSLGRQPKTEGRVSIGGRKISNLHNSDGRVIGRYGNVLQLHKNKCFIMVVGKAGVYSLSPSKWYQIYRGRRESFIWKLAFLIDESYVMWLASLNILHNCGSKVFRHFAAQSMVENPIDLCRWKAELINFVALSFLSLNLDYSFNSCVVSSTFPIYFHFG